MTPAEIDRETDSMIMSLMDNMKALSFQSQDLSEDSSIAKLSNLDQMKTVLHFYDNVIEQFSKIAENIVKAASLDEELAGVSYTGSMRDGTYLPEFSESFDTYWLEEDGQRETIGGGEVVDPEFESRNPGHNQLLKVLPTEKPGYYIVSWSEYGLERKRQWEEKYRVGPVPKCSINVYIQFTEEFEYEGINVKGRPAWFKINEDNAPTVNFLMEEDVGMRKKFTVCDIAVGLPTTIPCLKEEWVNEKRRTSKWLRETDLLEKYRHATYSVVAKSWKSHETNLSFWRISYSWIEKEFVNSLPREPKICLIILKAIRRKHLSKPKGLISDHMKSVFLFHLDKNGSDWKRSDRAQNILRLLAEVAEALQSRSLPRYFEPRLNTMESLNAETATELERKVQEIIRSPRILLEGCLFQSMSDGHKKEHFQRGCSDPVWFDKPPSPHTKSRCEDFLE